MEQSTEERMSDYLKLMNKLQELDFQGKAVPSDLVLIGNHAFPLTMNPRGQVLMAASRYGQGRIVVLGHEKYLSLFPDLVENALVWLMPSSGSSNTIGIQKSLSSLADNLCYCSLETKIGDFQSDYAVYVSDAYSVDACAKDMVAFLKSGGGLLIAGQAWSWAKDHPEENTLLNFPGNKVCSVAGIYFSEHKGELGKFSVPMQIPSSWLAVSIGKDFSDDLQCLLEGVSEFDIQGGSLPSEVMVHGPLAFPIGLTKDGRAFIAGAYYGQGKVIVATHEGYLGRDSLSTFLVNAVRWLDEGRNGVIGILPQFKQTHRILSNAGLKCEFTGFREDLSVFVCTSYSDAQCKEIQEFVAEGCGLLIGGHAWYWAQSNPHRNVMTDNPGNLILSKMGLSLMGSTLPPGLYKAQEVPKKGKPTTYHFRDLLKRFAGHVIQGDQLTQNDQECLNKLRHDCAHYLRMQAHDSASYTSTVALITDMVKEAGVPQVSHTSPLKSAKDKLLLHMGTEVYKVCQNPDELLPILISNIPKLPVEYNARVRISANTADCEEWISTGLYLSPGMKTYIAVPSEFMGKGWKLQIGCQTDYIGNADSLNRAPVVHERFPLEQEMPQVWNLWGGLLYLIAPPRTKVDAVELVVQQAVRAPYYKSGFMHAGYPIMIHSYTAPEMVNVDAARKRGLWGFIHELGHNQQRNVWEFPPNTTECTCNLWSVYVHEEVLGINRAAAHTGMLLEKRQSRAQDYANGGRQLKDWGMWTALETYMQLQDTFGWDAFKKVFAAYHSITNVPGDNNGKMNLYAETFSRVVKKNLAAFFKAWGWPIQPSTEEKLSDLPEWADHPMAQYA